MPLPGYPDMPEIAPDQAVLIAGPTASGKSELALRIAETAGGVIVNADASQVFDCWQVITARPSRADLARAPHMLYGHLPWHEPYSVGHWLREVAPLVQAQERLIIVGGTGLYFSALTQGLSQIPAVSRPVRCRADQMPLEALIAEVHPDTLARLDLANRARVQRAWEVQMQTGEPLHHWQATRPPALLPEENAARIVMQAPPEWLNPRIERRFDQMLARGAIDEVAKMAPLYDPDRPAFRAIGVPEIMAHLTGEWTLAEARERAVIATRQFAKRQRTWFRSKMRHWSPVNPIS